MRRKRLKVYRQTTPFTCGPACLLMALRLLLPGFKASRKAELEIWSEAVVAPIKGTSSFGLAYSAAKRGLKARVVADLKHSLIYVPKGWKDKDIIEALHASLRRQHELAKKAGVEFVNKTPNCNDVIKTLKKNRLAIVLVDMKPLHGTRIPHWILIHEIEKDYLLAADPFDGKELKLDCGQLEKLMKGIETNYNVPRSLVEVWK